MAASANQLITAQEPGGLQKVLVAASTTLYQGTMAFAIAASGYADDDTATGANAFLGVVKEKADNSSGSAGDIAAEVYTTGVFEFTGSSLTQALVGDKIYASDNFTVTATSTNNTLIGRCVEFVSSTRIRVRIEVGTQA